MDVRLQQAIAAARAGKRDEAGILLDRFLEDNPEDVHGIFLKSTLATSKEERVESLQQVLALDPDHRGAKLMLERLGEPIEAETPVVVPIMVEPEPLIEERLIVEPEPPVDEPFIEEPEPIVEPEFIIPEEEVEPIVVTEEDARVGDIEATAIALTVAELESEMVDEDEDPIEEIFAPPALDETLVVYPDEPAAEEYDEFPELSDEGEYDEEEFAEFPVLVDEEEFDEFPQLDEDEEVPDWLAEDAGFAAEEATVQDELIDQEEMPLEMGELPDWLQEEPTEEWLAQEQIEPVETFVEFKDDLGEKPDTISQDTFEPSHVKVLKPAPQKKKPRLTKQILEIALVFLIILALGVMAGLAYVFITMLTG